MTISTLTKVQPADVHGVLARHMLADGFDLVFDYEKSHGSWLHDARSGREYLDFITFSGSNPIGFNHPGMKEPEFLKVLHRVAQLKPALSDLYSVEYAQFVETLGRLAIPPYMKYAFFVEGGALGVENALKAAFDWKVRRNKAKGIAGERGSQVIHFREAFHGRSGYTLSLTNTDPVKTDYFPKFRWPRIDNPKLRFPVTPRGGARRGRRGAAGAGPDPRAFADNPDDIAAIIIEPIQGEGGDNHFRPEFLQALERLARENACFFIVDEVQTGVGLTGKMWAHEHYGVTPDAMCLRQEDAGLRVPGGAEGGRGAAERLQGPLPHQLDLGRRPHRHGPLRPLPGDHPRGAAGGERAGGGRAPAGRACARSQRERGGLMSNARGRGLMIAFDLPTQGAARQGTRTPSGGTACWCCPAASGRSASVRRSTCPRPRRTRGWTSSAGA